MAENEKLSAQDIEDLKAIWGHLPASDPRKPAIANMIAQQNLAEQEHFGQPSTAQKFFNPEGGPAIDRWLAPTPHDPNAGIGSNILTALGNIGKGAGYLATHPETILTGIPKMAQQQVDLLPGGKIYKEAQTKPKPTLGQATLQALPSIEQGIGGAALMAAPEAALRGGAALRSAAIGDPDAAGLRGLRVGPASPKSLSTIRAVQGSRPFLSGAKSLEDLQSKIPDAKNEIWGPYKETVDALSSKKVKGPGGETTVGELEAERQQLSALNRGLKKQNPEAIQLAQQKGMTQAQLLAQEKAVQNALDPHLEQAGIAPKVIRQTFGQVSQIGERVSGKSTLAEPTQPYGFSKLRDISLTKPASNIPLAGDIARDVAAGRYFSAKPTDVALREAFRPGGAKPDFGAFKPGSPPIQPKQLEANVAGNAPFGPEPSEGGFPARPVRPGYAPPYPQLTAEAGPTRGIRDVTPNAPPQPSTSARMTTLKGPQPPANPDILRPSQALPPTRLVSTTGEIRNVPRGLLPEKTQPDNTPPPATSVGLFPPGSAYRGVQETPYYPPGSQFRAPAPKNGFDLEEYLRNIP